MRAAILLSLATTCLAGCVTTTDTNDEAQTETSEIRGGTPATGHPEAVLLNRPLGNGRASTCSGALIAPRVVLTAGHCAILPGWEATAPYAGGQHATSTGTALYDFAEATGISGQTHDVGLIFLSSPITLTRYATVARTAVPDGTRVQNIGRTINGAVSWSDLYTGAVTAVSNGASVGYPNHYKAEIITEGGDSGGPAEIVGTTTIIGVCSGILPSVNVGIVARVDGLGGWIDAQVNAHGGYAGAPASPPPGASSTVSPLAARGLCLDVAGANTANGTPVRLWTCNGSAAQRWTYEGGTLRALGKCLDLPNGNTANGTRLQLWDCLPNNPFQRWSIAGGALVYAGTGQCLDVTEGRFTSGTPVQIWGCNAGHPNQQWALP